MPAGRRVLEGVRWGDARGELLAKMLAMRKKLRSSVRERSPTPGKSLPMPPTMRAIPDAVAMFEPPAPSHAWPVISFTMATRGG